MIWLLSQLGVGGFLAEILEAILYLIIFLVCVATFGGN